MKVDRKAFLKIISMVRAGVSENPVQEQSGDIVFESEFLKAYNDEVSVMFPFETGITGSVPAAELVKYLSAVKDDEVELKLNENEFLVVGKKKKAGFIFNPEIVLSFDEILIDDDWHALPENLITALNFSSFCSGKDMSRPVLTNLCVRGEYLFSSDGFRLMRYKLACEVDEELLIPNAIIGDIARLAPVEYQKVKGWVHFRNSEGAILSFRVQDFEFPDANRLIDEFEGDAIKLPTDLEEVLSAVGVFSQKVVKTDEDVWIHYTKNNVKVRAQNERGWAESEMRVRYVGKPFDLCISLRFINDISGTECEVKHNAGRLYLAGENFEHLMVLKHSEK